MDSARKKRRFTTFEPSPQKEVKKQKIVSSPLSSLSISVSFDEEFDEHSFIEESETKYEEKIGKSTESCLFPLDWSIKTTAKFTATESFGVRVTFIILDEFKR